MSLYTLRSERLTLRPLRFRDRAKWNDVRAENREWLTPWEATLPRIPEDHPAALYPTKRPTFYAMVSSLNREARARRSYSFALWSGPNLIGQITLGGVIYGALRGAHIGYWVDKNYANRGLVTEAVKRVTDFAYQELGLHRIEINVRPENGASCRVAEKAGYQFEGERAEFLHIDGAWRDHRTYISVNPYIQ